MPFSPDYLRLVLRENFADATRLFVDPLMAIHYAHLAMLAERGIVPAAEARAIRGALDGIDRAALQQVTYDGTAEDLFFHLNQRLAEACGEDVAGRLHTARSRNDIDMTMYRMVLREGVLAVGEAALALRRSLLDVAAAHTRTVFPAHTHAQPAQPTTVAHYLLAVVEELERSATRLAAAYRTTNRCPLGACAITGTGFPIDRQRTSDLLGFDGPTGNTYGSIATVDYVLESAAAAGVLVVGLGRVAQDLLLWSTVEVGYLRLPDGFVQISSIMPQKRNPVALEHARALLSRASAELTAIAQVPHNTPFGDIVDTEDDLQPLVHSAFRNATRAVSLLAVTLASASFDVEKMRARAAGEWVTVTELADALVRDHGLPFGAAHAIVTSVVAEARQSGGSATAASLAAAARRHGHDVAYSDADLSRILSPTHFIEVRRTPGGPSPEVVGEAIVAAEEALAADRDELSRYRRALEDAARRRQQAVAAL